MTDYNDSRLAFEHALREHVRNATHVCSVMLQTVKNNDYSSVSATYCADDGGRWTVSSYHNNRTLSIVGAELSLTCAEWCRAFTAQVSGGVLRSLIAAPSTDPFNFNEV